MAQKPTSVKIASILDSGHTVKMWRNDSEQERQFARDRGETPTMLELTATDCDKFRANIAWTKDGEVIDEDTLSQWEIDQKVENRDWWVDKGGR